MSTAANTRTPLPRDLSDFGALDFFSGFLRDNFRSQPELSSFTYTFHGRPMRVRERFFCLKELSGLSTLSATRSLEIHASTPILFAWAGIPLLRFCPHPSKCRKKAGRLA